MKRTSTLLKIATPGAALAFVLLANPSNAATTLVDEDWQGVDVANGLRLDNTNTYAGWKFIQGNANIFRSQDTPGNGIPGGTEGAANQVLQFEWAGQAAEYDTGHAWSAADQFSVSFNATELNWGNATDRTVVLKLTETDRAADAEGTLIGTTLWTQSFALPEYNTANNDQNEDWSAAQTFSATFDASAWAGTPGSMLTFEADSADGRGLYIDNILLQETTPTVAIPEPSTTALLGLGGLALFFRRRK